MRNVTSLLAAASVAAALMTGAPSSAAPKHTLPLKPLTVDEENLSNLKQWMPKTYARWQAQLPAEFYVPNLKWLTDFAGVTSGLRAMVLDGNKTLVGGVCQPRWCANDVEVVIAPDHISGVVFFQNINQAQVMAFVGDLSSAELACLTRLHKDAKAAC